MIEIIMTDGSTSTGLTAINWANKNEHLTPRINAEYGYKTKGKETYPFGKDIFKAICPTKIGDNIIKENYCIKESDLTLIFIKETKLSERMSKVLQNRCLYLGKPYCIINLDIYDFYNIGIVVNLINENNYKIINITGEPILSNYDKQLLNEFLTIVYKMLRKEQHDYSKYIAYDRN